MIKNVDFQQTVETAFLKYGASVAQERALPDVRDFLKIGLRQGLYAQYTNKLTHKDKIQKAQKSVAAAMAQSYVHGDAAMYDTFIRAARPWSYRYPLEEVQGNYGNPTSPDSQAAARYVEMKAGELADYLFNGLKKNAIGDQWYKNYDDTEDIPSVFPSIGYWNIVNGCSGIAVALATSVPTFNLKEVNEALIKIIKNPNVSFDDIYCAPDFPCGGTIINAEEVKKSLQEGKGASIRIRCNLQYNPTQNMIQATELPYGVYVDTILEQLKELTDKNPDYGIEKITDHTKKTADIRIYLSSGVNPQKMIKKLYHDTSLENWYSINMILLDKGRFPKIFGWRAACDAYIEHIRICKRNEIQFDLDKALARLNIVEGLLIAAASIDEVVAIIRASKNPEEASVNLRARFPLNVEQTTAILNMKLSSLTKIDGIKLENEKEKLKQEIDNYRYLLMESTALDQNLIDILRNVADKFGDKRRTILKNLSEESERELEQEEPRFISIIGDEIQIMTQKKKKTTIATTNYDSLLCFTNLGIMYTCSLRELQENKIYRAKDIFNLASNEKSLLIINANNFYSYKTVVILTKNGFIKQSTVNEYNVRKKNINVVKLTDNDSVVKIFLSSSLNDMICVLSNNNYYNYYSLNEISITGRVTKGVKAIKLNKDEYVIDGLIHYNEQEYTTIFLNNKQLSCSLQSTARAVKGQKLIEV